MYGFLKVSTVRRTRVDIVTAVLLFIVPQIIVLTWGMTKIHQKARTIQSIRRRQRVR